MITENKIEGQKASSLSKTEYNVLHIWIKRKYGKASKCENPKCTHKSKYFDWSLIKGKRYERRIENFWQLCRSCHLAYDYTDEMRSRVGKRMSQFWNKPENKQKLIEFRTGSKHTEESKKLMSIKHSGTNNAMYGVRMTGTSNHMYGKHHSLESRKLIAKSRSVLNRTQINVIRMAAELGSHQIELAKIFSLSKASISRIVNKKRYIIL